MKTTVDSQGRIQLEIGIQRQLGIRPGDEVLVETSAEACVIRPSRASGLGLEGNVLVHHGRTTTSTDAELDSLRDERFQQLAEGLPQ